MKPYLIGNRWVDLDHVQSIVEKVCKDPLYLCFEGSVDLIYRERYLSVIVGTDSTECTYVPIMTLEQAQTLWDRFIEAWKNRDSAPNSP